MLEKFYSFFYICKWFEVIDFVINQQEFLRIYAEQEILALDSLPESRFSAFLALDTLFLEQVLKNNST